MHRFQNNNKLLKFQLLRLNEQCSFRVILRQKSWFEIDRAAIRRGARQQKLWIYPACSQKFSADKSSLKNCNKIQKLLLNDNSP